MRCPVSRLVAKAPHNDTWNVFVPLVHACDAGHDGGQPHRVVCGVVGVVDKGWVKTVGLKVRLVNDVEAEPTAQLIPATQHKQGKASSVWWAAVCGSHMAWCEGW